jgi:hypothetical protein
MRKAILYIWLLLPAIAGAKSIEDLKSYHEQSVSQFVTPESLDRLMNSLSEYEHDPLPGQDSIMLTIYQSVSNAYVKYSHYKQGYQVYNRYLAYKENMLAGKKTAAINSALNSVGERSRNDQTDEMKLRGQLSQIKTDSASLEHKLVFFKTNFSGVMIVLSIIFAVVLVSYVVRIFSLRSRINLNRGTMKDIHKLALTGQYEEGVRNALQQSMQFVEKETSELKTALRI